MHTATLLSVATVLTAMMAPTALADDFSFRKAAYTDCSHDRLGPERKAVRGQCLQLYESDHGIRPNYVASGCKIRGFQSGNCEGPSVIAFSSLQCHALRKPDYSYNIWSLRVDC